MHAVIYASEPHTVLAVRLQAKTNYVTLPTARDGLLNPSEIQAASRSHWKLSWKG
jgi:hypothetical protein